MAQLSSRAILSHLWRARWAYRRLRGGCRRRRPTAKACDGLLSCRRADAAQDGEAYGRLVQRNWSERLGHIAIAIISLRGDNRTQVLCNYIWRWNLAQINRASYCRHES